MMRQRFKRDINNVKSMGLITWKSSDITPELWAWVMGYMMMPLTKIGNIGKGVGLRRGQD
jgi:hypothetical protein